MLLELLRGRLFVVTVVGISMQPTYQPGDRLLVRRCALDEVPRGTAVVLTFDDPPFLVKRVVALPGDRVPAGIPVPDRVVPPGHLVVLGDNGAHSSDSRMRGYVPADELVGTVVRKLA